MDFFSVISNLRDELKKPLPGRAAHLTMSSLKRMRELFDFSNQNQAIKSSVLILLYPCLQDNSIKLVLILRPAYDGIHSGQISLPGGKFEASDGDLWVTAIRESNEEIGIDKEGVKIIGKLSELYIPPSNFIVHPFIGFFNSSPAFSPDPKEVAEIIEIRLDDLLKEKNVGKRKIHLRNGINIVAPCFIIDDHTIWGATAMILGEFKDIVKRFYK